jgi:hypothetical protein
MFITQNGLKQRDASSALLFYFSLECAIRKVQEMMEIEWDISAYNLC